MKKQVKCETCESLWHYTSMCPRNQKPIQTRKPLKRSTKPIKQKGRETLEYERWRDEIARPHCIERDGELCQLCFGERCGNQQLDLAHIDGRGAHHEKKRNLANVRLVGRYPCHYNETNHLDEDGKFRPKNPHKFNRI